MDEDGYFYIVDRKKELIKPGGYQVWPREVEEVITEHPKVLRGAAWLASRMPIAARRSRRGWC